MLPRIILLRDLCAEEGRRVAKNVFCVCAYVAERGVRAALTIYVLIDLLTNVTRAHYIVQYIYKTTTNAALVFRTGVVTHTRRPVISFAEL